MILGGTVKAFVFAGLLPALTCAQAAPFELVGRLQPARAIPLSLQGISAPFSATSNSDPNGKFHFHKLSPGTYLLVANGFQKTVEIGPSLANAKGRVEISINLQSTTPDANLPGRNQVSVRELAIPKEAQRAYVQAQEALGRRDVSAAIAHLQKAVELAPQFSAAWNHLGTIAYQRGDYAEAEADFRHGLEADPEAYEPLVNLGGVLVSLGKWSEALEYNRRAVEKNPHDALANSQLGMAYFFSGQMAPAEGYLTKAKEIDPSHFSHPQTLLAEIYLRRNQPQAAANELQDLISRHPDLANASIIKQTIARLRSQPH